MYSEVFMYYIWFILNFPKCIHLVNVNTIYRKETQGWLRGHWGVAGCMNCRVSGLLKKCFWVGFFCKWLSFERLLYSKNSFLISAAILTFSSDIRNYMSEWFCDAYSSTDSTSSQTKILQWLQQRSDAETKRGHRSFAFWISPITYMNLYLSLLLR